MMSGSSAVTPPQEQDNGTQRQAIGRVAGNVEEAIREKARTSGETSPKVS